MSKFYELHGIEISMIAMQQIPEVKVMISEYGKFDAIIAMYNLIDKTLEENGLWVNAKCHKGCSNCCHHNIYATQYEVDVIKEYMDVYDIKPNRRRLKIQKRAGDINKLSWNERKCAFLDQNNNCSIYEVRPIVCRTHNSQDDPKYCNIDKYPNFGRREGRILDIEALPLALALIENKPEMQQLQNYF